jgi:anti-anti-sigma factor
MKPAGESGQLTVSVRPWTHGLVLRPEGELDHDTAGPFREALESALSDGPVTVVVDCGGLEFCDSTGLNLLLRARLTAEATGGRMVLAAATPMIGRMLEITGAREVFQVYETVDDAVTEQDGR